MMNRGRYWGTSIPSDEDIRFLKAPRDRRTHRSTPEEKKQRTMSRKKQTSDVGSIKTIKEKSRAEREFVNCD
jgi:hypothetical protein